MTAMKNSSEEFHSPAPALSLEVEFVEPIPGFPGESSFLLTSVDDHGLLFALRSVRSPGIRFIVASPGRFFPDYCPDVHEDDVTQLGLVDNDEVQVFVVVSVTTSIRDATANLLAPIILVPGRNTAMQVILSDDRLPLRAPLLAPAG